MTLLRIASALPPRYRWIEERIHAAIKDGAKMEDFTTSKAPLLPATPGID